MKPFNNMTVYRDTPVLTKQKLIHIRKLRGRIYNSFIIDNGDIPVGQINRITNQLEHVDNPRGLAYATRNKLKFRKTKKALLNRIKHKHGSFGQRPSTGF